MMERVGIGVYRAAMGAVAGAAAVAGRLPGLPGAWRGAEDRLGRLTSADRAALSCGPVLWMHAASVGELRAVRPLLAALRDRRPGCVVLATTLTRTGLALARELAEVDVAMLLPLDAAGPVRGLLDTFQAEAFCFTETEIWPTLLIELARRRVRAFMVSGRVSPRTAARTRWLRPVYRRALAQAVCCMQSAEDAARVTALGAEASRVHVAGNLKFEHVTGPVPEDVRALGALLAGRPVVVAGSTHEGEEAAILDAYAGLVARHRQLVLLLAPRHPERLEAVARLVGARGLTLARYRALVAGETPLVSGPVVILLDVMGPLAHCYALGRVAFVGGSLVPIGGHNVVEPARAGRPVLVGPYTATAGDAVRRILDAGGGQRVRSADELALALIPLLDDPAAAGEMGRRAQAAIAAGEGALDRHLALIDAHLGPISPARAATA
jgi:3-deoxy-D-manno-octulosonic-acid transferase